MFKTESILSYLRPPCLHCKPRGAEPSFRSDPLHPCCSSEGAELQRTSALGSRRLRAAVSDRRVDSWTRSLTPEPAAISLPSKQNTERNLQEKESMLDRKGLNKESKSSHVVPGGCSPMQWGQTRLVLSVNMST